MPFGTSLLFRCRQMPSFVLGVEICEDLWSALPPSTFHALAGATVIANLSASDETVGKAEYRRALVSNQSARLLCGYLYASAGHGESTQDMVFAGHDLIAENGTLLAEVKPFAGGLAETELDCQRMELERARNTSFEPSTEGYQTVEFDLTLTDTVLTRWVDPTPFIPHNEQLRAERCELILKMQADGLAKRLEHARAKTAVIGISGGLDQLPCPAGGCPRHEAAGPPRQRCAGRDHALLRHHPPHPQQCRDLMRRAGRQLYRDRHRQHRPQPLQGHRPGRERAGRDLRERPGPRAHPGADGHCQPHRRPGGGHRRPFGAGPGLGHLQRRPHEHVRRERRRTQNAGAPPCPVRSRHRRHPGPERGAAGHPRHPCVPRAAARKDNGEIAQRTEDLVGPYELHDFYLYYVLRFGFGPAKIFRLARAAFAGREEYPDAVLYKWLRNFYWRFFAQQFKRSCLPDGPKIGSVTLSPRGDWRMPSDACAALWLAELEQLFPQKDA